MPRHEFLITIEAQSFILKLMHLFGLEVSHLG